MDRRAWIGEHGSHSPCRSPTPLPTVCPVISFSCSQSLFGWPMTRPLAVAIVSGLALSACTAAASDAAPSATVAAAQPPATQSPTTQPPTTLPPTTTAPQWTDEEQEIIDAHDAFRAAYFTAATSSTSDLLTLGPLTTPTYGDSLSQLLEHLRADGTTFEGTYEYRTVAVELTGPDTALVVTCVLDQVAVFEDGVESDPPDDMPALREAIVVRSDGQWLVSGSNDVGSGQVGNPCDL